MNKHLIREITEEKTILAQELMRINNVVELFKYMLELNIFFPTSGKKVRYKKQIARASFECSVSNEYVIHFFN